MKTRREHVRQLATEAKTDKHYSPMRILAPIRKHWGGILVDPFWGPGCYVDPVIGIDEQRDGFKQDWRALAAIAREHVVAQPWMRSALDVYSNGPYSRMTDWGEKCAREAQRGVEQISLIKNMTSEGWYRRMVWDTATAVCHIYGRVAHHEVQLNGEVSPEGNTALFSSAVIYHGSRHSLFELAFGSEGKIHWLR